MIAAFLEFSQTWLFSRQFLCGNSTQWMYPNFTTNSSNAFLFLFFCKSTGHVSSSKSNFLLFCIFWNIFSSLPGFPQASHAFAFVENVWKGERFWTFNHKKQRGEQLACAWKKIYIWFCICFYPKGLSKLFINWS